MTARISLIAAVGLVALIVFLLAWRGDDATIQPSPTMEQIAQGSRRLPRQDLSEGYASSTACRQCHTQEYGTWHDSYHRTMTQVVTPDSIAAPISDERLESRGRTYHFQKKDGRFFVTMADIEEAVIAKRLGLRAPSRPHEVSREIVMSTGSHHYQTYWVNGSRGNQLWQVPWIYHLSDKRWIPAEDAFLVPPGDHRRLTDWNDNCIQCHTVRGEPNYLFSEERYDTKLVDFGIACESCHGPGRQHVAFHQSAEIRQSSATDPIVNPAKLNSVQSSQVCGQCHSSFHIDDVETFLDSGHQFRPGDDLFDHVELNRLEHSRVQESPESRSGFWADGTIRLAGREFNGFSLSQCYLRGEASCFSCHSLHGYEDVDDQLGAAMRTDKACLQCHDTYADRIQEHTHHAAESPGSRCYNCHMPYTSFGLFKAVRSHQIESPSALATLEYRKPNACNLCHLDRTLAWTSNHLSDWYGHKAIPPDADVSERASGASMLLKGDAVQRVITAWHAGYEPSRAASGDNWQVPLLVELLNDGYSVVRYVAEKSLRRFPGMDALHYDFLAPEEERLESRRNAIDIWARRSLTTHPEAKRAVFLTDDGQSDSAAIKRAITERDNRPVMLPE